MIITPTLVEQLYIRSTPHQINGADALLHFVILQEEGYTEEIVTVLSEPFETTYGRRMLSELIEPLSAQRNGGAILGPMVRVDGNFGEWHKYGAVLYGLEDKNIR